MDKIKSVMSGFQLPSSNIPDWAKKLSDDQWQKIVTNKLVTTSSEPSSMEACGNEKPKTSPQQEAEEKKPDCDKSTH